MYVLVRLAFLDLITVFFFLVPIYNNLPFVLLANLYPVGPPVSGYFVSLSS